MLTYIIIGLVVVAVIIIACLLSSKVLSYVKWIGGGVAVIGGVIVLIATLGKKKSDQKADAKISGVQSKIDAVQGKIDQDQAAIAVTDNKIKQNQADAQKQADDAKKKAEANQASTTDKPGDAAVAADELNNALK